MSLNKTSREPFPAHSGVSYIHSFSRLQIRYKTWKLFMPNFNYSKCMSKTSMKYGFYHHIKVLEYHLKKKIFLPFQ